MKIDALFELFTRARALSGHRDFVVIGSLSVLGVEEGDNIPDSMTMSNDVDAYTREDPARVFDLLPALGEGSPYHLESGIFLNAVSPALPTLPPGWEERLFQVERDGVRLWFLDPNDAAMSKYARGEARDRRWIRAGLQQGLVSLAVVGSRLRTTRFLDAEEERSTRVRIDADRDWFDTLRAARSHAAERARDPALPRAVIREPRLAPVIGSDAHLPAIAATRLLPDALRERFAPTLLADGCADTMAWRPELPGDGERLDSGPLRQAAVLVPLVRRPEGLTVLLTRRTDHLHHHAGQISFPGGRTDPEDADAVATALREAREEVGIQPDEVEVIGRLPVYTTVTAYAVTPVVGLLWPPRSLAMQAFEVAEVFEVPLAFLMNPAHHRRHAVELQGRSRRFLSMPWGEDTGGESYFIWGATAAMLRNLYGFLAT